MRYQVQSEKMSQFSRFFRKLARMKTWQITYKASEHNIMCVHYFCAYQQDMSNFSFILYPLFILLPNYLRQVPFSIHFSGKDADDVAAIVIALLLHWVGHRHLRHCQSCIGYNGAGLITLLAVTLKETEVEPLFRANCCRSAEGGTPLYFSFKNSSTFFLISPIFHVYP